MFRKLDVFPSSGEVRETTYTFRSLVQIIEVSFFKGTQHCLLSHTPKMETFSVSETLCFLAI
jgi:hypothetical protein